MYTIVRWCLNNRPVVILFALILMGAGVASSFRINQELLPSVEFPAVYIRVPDPGAGPQQVDRDLTGMPQVGENGPSRIRVDGAEIAQAQLEFDLAAIGHDVDARVSRAFPHGEDRGLQPIHLPRVAVLPERQTCVVIRACRTVRGREDASAWTAGL